MKKLLNFFLPKLAREIPLTFAIACAGALGTRFIPQTEDYFLFEAVILFIFFPLLCFLNPRTSISMNAEWVLLTPVKKTSIIAANAVVNTLKLLAIGFLCSCYFLLVYWEKIHHIFRADAKGLQNITILTGPLATCLIILVLGVSVIYSVTGGSRRQLNLQQDYTPPKDFLRNRRAIGMIIGAFLILFLLPNLDVVMTALPTSLLVALFLAGMLTGAVSTTFEALRFYYSKKKLRLAAGGIYLLFSLVLILNAKTNLNDSSLPLADRMNEFSHVTFLFPQEGEKLSRELASANEEVEELRMKDIKNYFEDDLMHSRRIHTVRTAWNSACLEKLDYHCRLASYIVMPESRLPDPALLKESCTSDVRGCSELFTYVKLTPEERSKFQALYKSHCDKLEKPHKYCKD